MNREHNFDCIETAIRKIVFPVVGVAGIIYEELQGDVDAALLGVYLSLVGLGAVPWVRALGERKPNG
jgi:hypothetical protein